jgi:hypothetical protein
MSEGISVMGQDQHEPVGSKIAARYEKLLLFRLLQLAERLSSDNPELVSRTGFTENWALVKRLVPGTLLHMVRQPLLDAWVYTAECIVRRGLHVRYPKAHPSRHLKDFSRLVLSWATCISGDASGVVPLLGRQVVPLLFGNALLVSTTGPQCGQLHWHSEDGRLEIRIDEGLPVALVNGEGRAQSLHASWEVINLPRVGDIIVDVWTPEYVGCAEWGQGSKRLISVLEEARVTLEGRLSPLLDDFVRCVTTSTRQEGWTAGLIRWAQAPESEGGHSVIELAWRDRIERWLSMNSLDDLCGPASEVSDYRALLVKLGARWVVCHLLGETFQPLEAERWSVIVDHLSRNEGGTELLRELGVPFSLRSRSGNAEIEATGESTLSLDEVSGLTSMQQVAPSGLTLRKTRRATAYGIVDWSVIDSLARVDQSLFQGELESIAQVEAPSEAVAYYTALLAYLKGQYELVLEALYRCLRYDTDVEEYWHLLAFSLRHLGLKEEFERVMFDGERDLAFVETLPRKSLQVARRSQLQEGSL